MSQALKPGEVAVPGATILTLADLREVTLNVFVPENRIGQVKLGGKFNVSVDSFPGKIFSRRVSRIGNSPEFTPRKVVTAEERLNTFYVVKVELSNGEGLLKPGMPADATFNRNRIDAKGVDFVHDRFLTQQKKSERSTRHKRELNPSPRNFQTVQVFGQDHRFETKIIR